MATQKFEVYGSVRKGLDSTKAFVLSEKSVTMTYTQMLEAMALYRHKEGINVDKCLGYKITDGEVVFYFEK